jgi:hypothetical protein
MAGSDWRALRAVGSAASCGVNAIPAALEALLVRDTGFPGEVLRRAGLSMTHDSNCA